MDAEDARAALRLRLGPGARYDDASAPAADLLWARLGTAYFARRLNQLTDADLTADTERALQIRTIVCSVSHEARALAQVAEVARTGHCLAEREPCESVAEALALAVTLPAAAIRHLFKHSAVHLNVEWRDLDSRGWDAFVSCAGGQQMHVRATVWQRARSIWLKAVDLGNGGSFRDLPPAFAEALLSEASGSWRGHEAFLLSASDRDLSLAFGQPATSLVVRGKLADLARWITGRGAHGVTATGALPAITPA